MTPFRFVVVGSGEIAGFYMDFFNRRPDKQSVEFAGACELVEERGKAFVAKFGGKYYPTMDAVLADKTVDAVVILTMPGAHAPLAKQALAGGKHVHVEKPLAMNLEDALDAVKLAEQKHLTYSCSPFIALGQAQQKVKRMLHDGTLGKPLVATADQYHGRLESWHPAPAQFYKNSGGPLRDVGPYPLTLMVDWFGPVASVRSMCVTALPTRKDSQGKPFTIDVFDHATMLLNFASGVMGRIDISNVNIRSELHGMEVHCADGSMSLQSLMDSQTEMRISRKSADKWEQVEGDPKPKPASGVDWSTGIIELAQSVRENRPSRCSARMALHVLQVLLAAEQSSREGREVQVQLLLPF